MTAAIPTGADFISATPELFRYIQRMQVTLAYACSFQADTNVC